ncbi:CRAL-TRIO domain-containing protein [Xylariaceae sp. FL0016]|nr:CRAL-TRIO domain-containing protein [Xylariaceae sp. FL0016]
MADEKPTTVPAPAASDVPATASSGATEPPAATPAAEATETSAAAPALKPDEPSTPLRELWKAAQAASHGEIWGVELADPATHVPSQIVFQKYLNANDGDVVKAREQLTKTLSWRAEMKPLELVKQTFSQTKFGGLGYVTKYAVGGGEEKGSGETGTSVIFTWNVYGIVKSMEETFGNLDEFIKWRVALMEIAVLELNLASATQPITVEKDHYKIYQVHDYKSISFLRQAPQVKAASTETIKVFATAYPELLKEKFFVNVPAIMGFLYTFIKRFVAPATAKKFHPMANGENLAKEFGEIAGLGDQLPKEYGGKGEDLKTQGQEPSVG